MTLVDDYDELLARLAIDLPTTLQGIVQTSIVDQPAQGTGLTWDTTQQIYMPTARAALADPAWTSWTPTIGCSSGAITSFTTTCAYQKLNSGLGAFQFSVTLTNIGTAAGDMYIPLPTNFTVNGLSSCMTRETASTGNYTFCYCQSGATHMDMYPASINNGATIWVNNYQWQGLMLIPGTWS